MKAPAVKSPAETVSLGVRFLLERIGENGLWQDFETLAGASDEWVSGFVLFALESAGVHQHALAPCALSLASRQRPNGGWAYSHLVPPDCDSTAWATLALARATRFKPSVGESAARFMKRHFKDGGGFSTYRAHGGIGQYIQASEAQLAGWTQAHPCVTAVTCMALMRLSGKRRLDEPWFASSMEYLLDCRLSTGLWDSYWWAGRAYVTYQALKALLCGGRMDASDARLSLRSLADGQLPSGAWPVGWDSSSTMGAFETAFAVLALLCVPDEESIECARRGVCWLNETQSADGSWDSHPILRIPSPLIVDRVEEIEWETDKLGTNVKVRDHNRVFTTAAALWALATFERMIV